MNLSSLASKVFSNPVSSLAGDLVGEIAGKALGKGLSSLLQDGIGGLLGKGLNLGGGLGNIAEKICDTLLPKELESVGDLVSMAINCSQGNYPAAIQDGLDFLQDAPAILEKLGNNAASVPGFTPWSIGAQLNGPSAPSQTSNPTSFTPIGQQGEAASTTAMDAKPASEATAGTKISATESKPMVEASASKATAGTKKPSTDGKVGESDGAAAAKAFLDAHPNPEDLMAQVRDGKIPPEVMNSPAGMRMLQQKIYDIQMMNQLMTQMLKTLHDMNMAIVQNMRV